MPTLHHPLVILAGRIIGIFLVISLSLSVLDTYKKLGITKEYEAAYAETKAENDRLKKALAQAQTPEYVEREARDKLGLVKDGESLVLMGNGQAALPAPRVLSVLGAQEMTDANLPNWKKWWKLFF